MNVIEILDNIIRGFIACWPFFIVLISIYVFKYLPYVIKYLKSNYKKESNVNLLNYLINIGTFGEGLTFFELEKLPFYSKIMCNLYIPTEDGTTEIDLIYICPFGIYVIENKNYSGLIFGNEKSKEWTSVIYKTKHKFFNPIWQNKNHIKYLNMILKNKELKSMIVFSKRCQLKFISSIVIKRGEIKNIILNNCHNIIYINEEIDDIYSTLKQFANKTKEEKKKHVDFVNNKITKK